MLTPLCINNSKPWGFFDRAYQGLENKCDLDFSLYLTHADYFLRRANIGFGSNNLAKFYALFVLLKLAIVKRVINCHIYGDSNHALDG
jgi:hypothetical protein